MGISLSNKQYKETIVGTLLDLTDTNSSNILAINWAENDTSDRTLGLLVSGGNRTLTLSGNSTIDQNVATGGSPTFVAVKNYASVSDHATSPFTVSADEVRGSITTNLGAGGTVTCTLPAATVGMKITFYIDAAFALVVTPASGEQLMVLTAAANKTLTSDAVVGTYLQLVCLQAAKWYPAGWSGTWTSS